ncbi:hypothetical protein RSAG8_12972, partial [Rhizoctonia solani AG-8 WAC10335]
MLTDRFGHSHYQILAHAAFVWYWDDAYLEPISFISKYSYHSYLFTSLPYDSPVSPCYPHMYLSHMYLFVDVYDPNSMVSIYLSIYGPGRALFGKMEHDLWYIDWRCIICPSRARRLMRESLRFW